MGLSIAMRAGIAAIAVAALVALAGPAAAGPHSQRVPSSTPAGKVVQGDVVDARALHGRRVQRASRYSRPQIRRYTR